LNAVVGATNLVVEEDAESVVAGVEVDSDVTAAVDDVDVIKVVLLVSVPAPVSVIDSVTEVVVLQKSASAQNVS
jgi:hypothetical protein